jgi:hypothetical protein
MGVDARNGAQRENRAGGMSTKTHLLIGFLALLAIVMVLYATGPETVTSAPVEANCGLMYQDTSVWQYHPDAPREPCWKTPSHDAAALERVWFAVVGE